MSFKWAVGATIAVMAGWFVLPGVATAHHPDVTGTVQCDDGTFQISVDYYVTTTNVGDKTERIYIEGDRLTATGNVPDGGIPAGMTGTINEDENGVANVEDGFSTGEDPYFNWSDDRDQFEANNYNPESDPTQPDFDNFFVLDGTYDSVDALADDAVTVEARQFVESTENFNNSPADPELIAEDTISTDDFWTECSGTFCVDGDPGIEGLSFQTTDTGDCGLVTICRDGQDIFVSEFDAEQILNSEESSCAPPPPPPVETPTIEVVEDAAPIEEVAALPAAGYGTTTSGFAWSAVAALALAGIGGGAVLAARRK